MTVEHLIHFDNRKLAIVAAAVSWLIKQQIKAEEKPDIDPSDLEIHHKNPIHNGGGNSRDNLEAVTRVEHAQRHFQSAVNSKDDWDFASREYLAVRLIIQRMNPSELDEFNTSINNS